MVDTLLVWCYRQLKNIQIYFLSRKNDILVTIRITTSPYLSSRECGKSCGIHSESFTVYFCDQSCSYLQTDFVYLKMSIDVQLEIIRVHQFNTEEDIYCGTCKCGHLSMRTDSTIRTQICGPKHVHISRFH